MSIIYKIMGILLYFFGGFACVIGIFLTFDILLFREKAVSTGDIIIEMIIGIFIFLIGYLIFRFGRKMFQKNGRLVPVKEENL